MEGMVSAVSEKTQGVKIGDVWYNAKKIWDYCKGLSKGDEVSFEFDGSDLTFIKVINSAPEEEVSFANRKAQSENVIVRENVLRTTVEYLKLTSNRPQTVEEVLELAERFEKWIKKENDSKVSRTKRPA